MLCAGGFGTEVALYARQSLDGVDVSEPESVHAPGELEVREGDEFVIACGEPANRARLAEWVKQKGGRLRSILHPRAYVSPSARIDPGAVICPFSFVGPNAHLSHNVVLNIHSSCGHDALLGEATVLAPYAFVAGDARVGEGVFLGSYSFVAQGIAVGRRSKVSAGSIVMRDVAEHSLAMGNPASSRQMFADEV